ncbi:MAG: NFACT RNA binding domain-containing protein [Treponema sp.]|nr:NFACT RNA binding domain-containing protein [Treponema sp.]
MSLNCNEIDTVLAELDLAGAFIQDIVQPSYDSIALYTYKPGEPKTVFISLAAASCRIHETRRKIPKNAKPLRFNELLKSRIKGARITDCHQIQKNRIIVMTLHKDGPVFVMPAAKEKLAAIRNAHGSSTDSQPSPEAFAPVAAPTPASAAALSDDESTGTDFQLYIRLWSGAANIFLCEPCSAGDQTHRPRIIDSFYRRPAKGETSGSLLILPEPRADDGKVWPVRDFSEIQSQWEEQHPDLPAEKRVLTFSQKADLFYSQNAQVASLTVLREQADKWYNEHKSRQSAALERLADKRRAFQNAAQWKHQGDLILAYSYLFNSLNGADFLACEDYETGNQVRIKIDPKKNAQENAAAYYETYKKQTGGLEALEHDIARAEKAIAELDAQYERMKAETNPLKLEQQLRKSTTPKQLQKKAHPGLDYIVDGWQLIVGRDATENDELLRHHVRGSDLWLHTRDYAGGYVFIKNRPGKTVPLEILLYAGNLAVYYSKARKNAAADLYYTQVKHLRRAKNGPKGLVLPTHEKNLYIKLDESKLRELEDLQ